MTVDDLLSTLHVRVNRFTKDADPSALFAPEALTEAKQLWEAAIGEDGGISADAAHLLAWFHWFRHLASPAGNDPAEITLAARLFSTLATRSSDLVSPFQLAELGNSLLSRLQRTDDEIDLELAVSLLTHAIEAGDADPNLPAWLANLGSAYYRAYQRRHDPTHLDTAERYLQESITRFPPQNPYIGFTLANLSSVLQAKYLLTKSSDSLERMIASYSAAANVLPSCSQKTDCLTKLGLAYRLRYDNTMSLDDLDTAIEFGQEALRHLPLPDANQAVALHYSLGADHLTRFRVLGHPGDLHQCLELTRAAMQTPPSDTRMRYALSTQLANALQERFERLGELSDLDDAIASHLKAAAFIPNDDSSALATNRTNLAISMKTRYEQSGTSEDLERAITFARQAVEQNETFQRAQHLTNLGNSLLLRFEREKSANDLDEALRCHREAVRVTPPGHAQLLARNLANLANAYNIKYQHTGKIDDLRDAISILHDAHTAIPADSPDRAKTAYLLASYTRDLCKQTARPDDLTKIAEILTDATRSLAAPPIDRLNAARMLGSVAAELGNWDTATRAFATATSLIPQVAWRGVSRATSERVLSQYGGIASIAASCALLAGQHEHALEVLEAGRAVLWSQLTDMRTDLTSLLAANRELADRMEQIVAELSTAPQHAALIHPHHSLL